jgi:hypothetical protein
VQALPLIVGALLALAIAPGLHAFLAEHGHVRTNYRGAALPCPFGLLIVATVAVGAGILAVVSLAALDADIRVAAPEFVLAIAALGLADDAYAGASRGLRGHGAALARGAFSTGALKAIGTLGVALWAFAGARLAHGWDTYVLEVVVVVLATNLFNLVDLRPGRVAKAFVLLLAGVCLIGWQIGPFWATGLYVGPIVVAGLYDVRERAMLGDTGSNVVGAVAGVLLVAAIHSDTGLLVAALVLAGITAYGEFRSISALVERTPGLRHLDSLGRAHRA